MTFSRLGKIERNMCLKIRGAENKEEQRREDLSRAKEQKNKKTEENNNLPLFQSLSLCRQKQHRHLEPPPMSHVCAVETKKNLLSNLYLSGKYGGTRNSCLLYVESRNESHHLVFWSLETLIGLRDRVRRLVV